MEETWKDIKDFEGKYQVSNLGRVKSLDRINSRGENRKGKILKPMVTKEKRLIVGLYDKSYKRKVVSLHRLVAKAFIPNPFNLPQVNHKDEKPLNNKVDNLEWCTAEYNVNYGTRNKRASDKLKKCFKKKVYQYTLENKLVREWESSVQAEREEGFLSAKIGSCCTGNRKTHKGFKWYHEPLTI